MIGKSEKKVLSHETAKKVSKTGCSHMYKSQCSVSGTDKYSVSPIFIQWRCSAAEISEDH